MYFKIFFTSDNNFSQFDVNVQKIDNLPNEDEQNSNNYLIIGIVILGVIQIVMFVVYIIKLKCKKEKRIVEEQVELIN